jgi:hypothetical protein
MMLELSISTEWGSDSDLLMFRRTFCGFLGGSADVPPISTSEYCAANGSVSRTELMNQVMADFAKADSSGDGQLQ